MIIYGTLGVWVVIHLSINNELEVLNMAIPSKPMSKNFNSKFTTRNNKKDIFSKLSKSSKPKDKATDVSDKPDLDKSNS
jgi:hypothetical protein